MTLDARIRANIEARIRSGEWRPGHRIPFEHELVAAYGCSRGTVSKALGALARAGFIDRRRKAGSFVAHPHIQSAVLDVPDLASMIRARGEEYCWQLIASEPVAAAGDLGDASVVGPLLHLEGLHHAGGDPFAYETRWIDLGNVGEAAEADFAAIAPGSWLLGHVSWNDARHRVSAIGASEAQARRLGLERGEACLQVERWTWRQGALVTFVRQLFPGSRYDLIAEFKPQS